MKFCNYVLVVEKHWIYRVRVIKHYCYTCVCIFYRFIFKSLLQSGMRYDVFGNNTTVGHLRIEHEGRRFNDSLFKPLFDNQALLYRFYLIFYLRFRSVHKGRPH